MSRDDELRPEERAALEAWTVPDAPDRFADRVVSAMAQTAEARRSRPSRMRLWRWVAISCAAVAALTVWQVRFRREPETATGNSVSAERQTIAIGERGVAVAEADANLSWTVNESGAAVAQSAGDVFYRVQRGGPFRVETPHGTVRVTGTCFRVELNMKRPWRDVAAAGIGAALVVTVYEGSVLFAGKGGGAGTRVVAGQSLVAGPGGSGAKLVDGDEQAALAEEMPPAPGESASREELLRRDAVQRSEIASLRAKVRQLADGDQGSQASGRPWFDPSEEDLIRFAAECQVQYDLPPVMDSQPLALDARGAERMGLSAEEAAAFNRVVASIHAFYLAEMRKLYVEVVGDASRAEELSPQALWSELMDKSPPGEEERANQKIAQERAGLAQPPANLASVSAVERGIRLQASLGDRTEREMGAALGAGRARALREKNGGWGMRQQIAGCPGGRDGEEHEIER